jgi:hypothetical protein
VSALHWSDLEPGDWVKAQSWESPDSLIQGVIESLHDHAEYGLVVSINDTRRAVVNWKLLEVRKSA